MAIEVYGAGGASKEAEQKTVTPTTSQQTVTPTDEDHELTQVTVEAMPSGALSDITVSAGRITAQVGTAGYLAAGTKKTKDLSRVPAQSYMPGTSDRVIISANQYTIGAQTLKGDANLVPENIAKGKTLFNVLGTYTELGQYIWEKSEVGKVPEYGEKSSGIANPPIAPQNSGNSRTLVAYRGELHIVGSYNNTTHYKYNGSQWVAVSTLPYQPQGSAIIVYNDEIHLIGGSGNNYNTKHYKWSGSTWETASTLPYKFYWGTACVYQGELHIMGSGVSPQNYHYAWDGTNWKQLTNLPNSSAYGCSAVYNDLLYIFVGTNNNSRYYKWNGSTYENIYDTSIAAYYGTCQVIGNRLVLMSGYGNNSSDYSKKWYEHDGSTWAPLPDLPRLYQYHCTTVLDGKMYAYTTATTPIYTLAEEVDGPGTFEGYVISDNTAEYPQNGAKDNKWYISVNPSTATYDTGTVTGSSSTASVTFSHSLGKVPENVIIMNTSPSSYSSYRIVTSVFNAKYTYTNSGLTTGTATVTKYNNSVTVTVPNGAFYGTCTWVVF